MGAFKDILQKLNNVFNKVTDWLLIVIGGVLVAKSAVAIDVPLAKYVVMGLGASKSLIPSGLVTNAIK